MKLIFADTVGLLAQWDETDQWHVAANQAMRNVLSFPTRDDKLCSFGMRKCGRSSALSASRCRSSQAIRETATIDRAAPMRTGSLHGKRMSAAQLTKLASSIMFRSRSCDD